MSGRWFGHSGDLGDIVYALPTVRAAGGGTLYLYHLEGRTAHGMSAPRVDLLRRLLELQPYIDRVVWCPDGHEDHDLNGFRDHGAPGRSLVDMHLATHGFGPEHRFEPWIEVDRVERVAPVVFARTERYRNADFPWRRVWARYGSHAVFLGLPDEHARFAREVGPVRHHSTRDLLEAARVIAGSRLFIGNQSVLHAVAEGMKHPIVLEVCPACPNCSFQRMGRIDAWDATVELPDVFPGGVLPGGRLLGAATPGPVGSPRGRDPAPSAPGHPARVAAPPVRVAP